MLKNSKRKMPWTLLVLVLGALLLVACGGADTSSLQLSQGEVATQAAVLQESVSIAATATPAPQIAESTPDAEAQVDEVVSPSEVSPTALPEIPRIDKGANWFEPTDPTTVELAAGKLQIFEFSAYW